MRNDKEQPETDYNKFTYFSNHGDEDGRNGFTVTYGDYEESEDIIVGTHDTEEDAIESVKRLNQILQSHHSHQLSEAAKGESGALMELRELSERLKRVCKSDHDDGEYDRGSFRNEGMYKGIDAAIDKLLPILASHKSRAEAAEQRVKELEEIVNNQK